MKEAIQKPRREVSVIIYDAPLPPRYFRFSKRFVKFLFITAPLFLLLLLGGMLIWGLTGRIQKTPVPTLPTVVDSRDSEIQSLQLEIDDLKKSNEEFAKKLQQPNINTTGAEEPFLLAIKRPYGMQNLVGDKSIALDQINLEQDANRAVLKFSIVNSKPDHRVTGHILVMMVSSSGIMAYPKLANATLAEGIKYSSGEQFAVSRLRPTAAEFPGRLTGESVKFLIYIFSREGDLLLVKETESYKVSTKG